MKDNLLVMGYTVFCILRVWPQAREVAAACNLLAGKLHPNGAHNPVVPFPIVTVDPGAGVAANVVFQFNTCVLGKAAVTVLLLTVIENTFDPVAAKLSDT